VIVTMQMIIGLLAVGLAARILVAAVRAAEARQDPSATATGAGAPDSADRDR
jgi:hypothetical protein